MKKLGARLSAFAAACALAVACQVRYVDEPPQYAAPPPQRQYQYAYASSPPPPQAAPPPAQPAPPPAAPPTPRPAPPALRPRPAPPPEREPDEYEAEPDYPYGPNYGPNPPPHHRHHRQPDGGAPAPASSLALTPAPAPAPASAHAPASAPAPAPAPASAPAQAPAVAACLDTGPSPIGDCSTVKPPSGCSPALSPAKKCATFKTYFDPKVAASAVSCMTGLSAKQVCDTSQITACSKGALAQACTDPSVTQVCQIAVTNCKASASECTVLLSGLNDDGQEKVAQCVAKGCPGGLFGCVDALK